jgi:hypothetical protein
MLDTLLARLPSDFVPVHELGMAERRLPSFIHRPTALCFVAVLAGEFVMGMTPGRLQRAFRLLNQNLEEYERITPLLELKARFSAHQPARRVVVQPFLLSAELAPYGLWRKLGVSGEGLTGNTLSGWGIHEAGLALRSIGLRLPSEAELEFITRLGVDELLPADDDSKGDEPAGESLVDQLGLNDELCADAWHDDYRGAPADSGPWEQGAQVVRAAARRPWGWEEHWAACVCPRRAERGLLPVAIRPAASLPFL